MKRSGDWWRRTTSIMAMVGLALAAAGYWAIDYVPLSSDEVEQERRLAIVRQVAEDMARHGGEPTRGQMADSLRDASLRHRRERPYAIPGRLAFYSGMGLLAAAVICWYRFVPPKPPAEEEIEDWEEEEESEKGYFPKEDGP